MEACEPLKYLLLSDDDFTSVKPHHLLCGTLQHPATLDRVAGCYA